MFEFVFLFLFAKGCPVHVPIPFQALVDDSKNGNLRAGCSLGDTIHARRE